MAQCTGTPITSFSITNVQDVTCNGGSDGSITVEIVGGEAPYVYELNVDFGGGGIAPFLNSPSTTDTEYTFSGLPAESATGGSYQIIVKTSNSHTSGTPALIKLCSERQITNIDLNQPDPIALDAGLTTIVGNTKCTGLPDGSIDLNASVSGGTGPYEYSLDGGAFSASTSFTVLLHGDYTLTVRDAQACTQDFLITIPDNRVAPTTTISPDPAEVCINTDLALDGNPVGGSGTFTTHSWTGDTGPLSATNIANPTFNTATPGVYNLTYTVTDDNGCTATDDITVTVNTEPPAADQTPSVCEDAQGSGQAVVDLTALEGSINGGGGITYSWYLVYDGVTLSNAIGTPAAYTVSDGEIVYAEVNDGSCTNVAEVTYTVNPLP
ncbi:MAG: hypothetical protein RIG62_02600, partial [Cyclobacteriaceae bacterium]